MSIALKYTKYGRSLHSFNPIPNGCVLYTPLWHPSLSGPVFNSVDDFQHTCSVTGAVWTPQGRTFDGSDDKITIPAHTSLDIETAGTLSCWVNAGTITAVYRTVMGRASGSAWVGSRLVLYTHGSDAALRLALASNVANEQHLFADIVFTAGTWVHLVITFNGTTIRPYLNGVAKTTKVQGIIPELTGYDFTVGFVSADLGYHLGSIDEVLIYNRALSAGEILHNYQATKWRYT